MKRRRTREPREESETDSGIWVIERAPEFPLKDAKPWEFHSAWDRELTALYHFDRARLDHPGDRWRLRRFHAGKVIDKPRIPSFLARAKPREEIPGAGRLSMNKTNPIAGNEQR